MGFAGAPASAIPVRPFRVRAALLVLTDDEHSSRLLRSMCILDGLGKGALTVDGVGILVPVLPNARHSFKQYAFCQTERLPVQVAVRDRRVRERHTHRGRRGAAGVCATCLCRCAGATEGGGLHPLQRGAQRCLPAQVCA